jgi:hypothetical protein
MADIRLLVATIFTRATRGASHLKGCAMRAGQSTNTVIRSFISYSFVCTAGVGTDSKYSENREKQGSRKSGRTPFFSLLPAICELPPKKIGLNPFGPNARGGRA